MMVGRENLRKAAEEYAVTGRGTSLETALVLETVVDNLTEEQILAAVLLRKIRDSRLEDDSLRVQEKYRAIIERRKRFECESTDQLMHSLDTLFRILELSEDGLTLDEIYEVVCADFRKEYGQKIFLVSITDLVWSLRTEGDVELVGGKFKLVR